MPILLTTPFDPGSVDPGKSYTHAKITRIDHKVDEKEIRLYVTYGYKLSGVWTPGRVRPDRFIIENKPELRDPEGNLLQAADPVFDNLAAPPPANLADSLYDQNAARLYQWLIDGGALAGTIE